MAESPPEVVRRWVAAVNAADADALLALADPEVRLRTPRGVLEGHDGVRTFAQRQSFGARMHAERRRAFHAGDTVVSEDEVSFRSVDDGSVMGEPTLIAASFVVRDGRLVEFAPHASLAAALQATGLTAADELA